MFPFWDIAIAPVLQAARARRVVEIGALRAETTELLLELLGPESELHVIDPRPRFDPSEHERRFAGRYRFHRARSHEVLPGLGAVDAALIDGDHNWYTVHGELELLGRAAREAGRPLPLLFMHDVCWPYGRRDLYYDPETVPAEHRRPFRRAGIEPGREEVVPRGGLNPTFANAVQEGGARNGVMTALEDFAETWEPELRIVLLPIYFGLAIVADRERLDAAPGLAAELDRLEGADARLELLRLAEQLRLRAMVTQHNAMFAAWEREARAARRYLDVVKAALLNRPHIENELRLEHLHEALGSDRRPDPVVLRDPARHLRRELAALELSREEGTVRRDAPPQTSFPYTTMGARRLDHLERCLDTLREEDVAGDLVEVGVGRGGGAIFMRAYLEAHELAAPRVWLADELRNPQFGEADDATADLNMVREGFARFRLLDARVRFLQGPPAETLAAAEPGKVALARVDAARIGDPGAVLARLYDRVALGGFVIVDGCADPAVRDAVTAFRERRGIDEALERVDPRALAWRKLESRPAAQPATSPPPQASGVPLVPAPREPACELSVLVVFHDMRREAERTLLSLSRGYQRGAEGLDYEVIAIDNGSSPGERLGEDFVTSFGPEFRLLDLGAEATPSPAHAINRAAELARGEALAVMVDGAHVLTPGVLRYATEALRSRAPAAVATQQWYVGPGQQIEAIGEGYDGELEDRLFELIGWPADGYRLFEIGHFVGTRDWLDGMWESNCLFLPRALAEQIGLMDMAFAMPGGGFANLDFYERVVSTPGLNVVTLLGEGSFHQLHGGTTTNQDSPEELAKLIASYHRGYEELRGRAYRARTRLEYLGGMPESANRTRVRRMGAAAFLRTAREIAEDRLPEEPQPLPEDTEAEFREAYWRSFRWKRARWLGVPVERAPGDLLAYQQMVAEARPEWIVTAGRGGGGRDLYLASLCELVGAGRVLALKPEGDAGPEHPAIEPLAGERTDRRLAAGIRERVGAPGSALLLLGLGPTDELIEAFNLLSPIVPVGSWVVFEDTIMNGHPIWPGMGAGPAEAVSVLTRRHPQFVRDRPLAQLGVTFNPDGYLKRTA